MQNRRFIAPKFHERPQIVSPLSAPPPEVTEEQKVEETNEITETPVVEDKKLKDSNNKKNN
jgi:hypothetical protein